MTAQFRLIGFHLAIFMIVFKLILLDAVYITHSADLEIEKGYMNPQEYDILLRDITPNFLRSKSLKVFGFNYNADAVGKLKYPIEGVFLGNGNRIIIPMQIKFKRRVVNSLCLFDTGSPYTYLTDETLRAVGIVDATDDQFNLWINQGVVLIYRSTNHFAEINLCGQSMFAALHYNVSINYFTRKATISRSNEELSDADVGEL